MSDILDFFVDLFKDYLEEIMKAVIQAPGAFIFWVFKGFKTTFKEEFGHRKRNMIVGGLFWFVLIAVVVFFIGRWLS